MRIGRFGGRGKNSRGIVAFERLAKVLRLLGLVRHETEDQLRAIVRRREELRLLNDLDLRAVATQLRDKAPAPNIVETFAIAAVAAERELGLRLFEVQILGALALQRGEIAEMQTGEGKTLAAVPAIVWFALQGRGVHVLTANDYLAGRDAAWMGGIYRWFGLSVAHISQGMSASERRAAYGSDITYATANEVGFDFLRDGLVRHESELVQRAYGFAVIDEADSILIDEARIPLVIAGGLPEDSAIACRVDAIVSGLRRHVHYSLDDNARNVRLTDAGIQRVEEALGCGSLFDSENLAVHTAAQDALHAHALLHRDVDYVVKGGAIELVDEFKGRIAENRRWPAGLHSAVEAKERLGLKTQGRVLGSITVRSLIGMYEQVCGMTGTAATQAEEFWREYRLPVTTIPTNSPMIREDLPDVVFADKIARRHAVVEEIRHVHTSGRPILVGTASVEESEALSRDLAAAGVPHSVLNARNDEAEAEIIAQAGALGAVTVSTNMAGRGTDILSGGNPPQDREKVLGLGGLYVIGTTRHEARRIDHQLRGRAGRQGDPGSSRFFVSLEDDLLVRFGIGKNPDIESVQRTAESQNLEIRRTLWKYDAAVEFHRREMHEMRREVLLSPEWRASSFAEDPAVYGSLMEAAGERAVEAAGRELALAIIDDVWSDYLANVAELRGSVIWTSWAVGDPVRQMLAGGPEFAEPLQKFLKGELKIYEDFQRCVAEGIAQALANARVRDGVVEFEGAEKLERGATWTYVTTDQPFGTFTERIVQGLRAKLSKKQAQD
jgi:preprotein translocase subunit SecA